MMSHRGTAVQRLTFPAWLLAVHSSWAHFEMRNYREDSGSAPTCFFGGTDRASVAKTCVHVTVSLVFAERSLAELQLSHVH